MPTRGWTAKRERQYSHIKAGLRERGEPEEVAEEIAARTVNKERARNGESRGVSRTSTDDISSGRRRAPVTPWTGWPHTRSALEEARRRRHSGAIKLRKHNWRQLSGAEPATECEAAAPARNDLGRGESVAEREDRNLMELVQELRVAGLGVQVLFGFLLSTSLFGSFRATECCAAKPLRCQPSIGCTCDGPPRRTGGVPPVGLPATRKGSALESGECDGHRWDRGGGLGRLFGRGAHRKCRLQRCSGASHRRNDFRDLFRPVVRSSDGQPRASAIGGRVGRGRGRGRGRTQGAIAPLRRGYLTAQGDLWSLGECPFGTPAP